MRHGFLQADNANLRKLFSSLFFSKILQNKWNVFYHFRILWFRIRAVTVKIAEVSE
jgi:hypothetical protein